MKYALLYLYNHIIVFADGVKLARLVSLLLSTVNWNKDFLVIWSMCAEYVIMDAFVIIFSCRNITK